MSSKKKSARKPAKPKPAAYAADYAAADATAAAQQAADIVAGVLAGKPNELPVGSQARQIATGMFHHLKRALEAPKPAAENETAVNMIELSSSGDVAGLIKCAKESIHEAIEELAPTVAMHAECDDVLIAILQALNALTAIESCHMSHDEESSEAQS